MIADIIDMIVGVFIKFLQAAVVVAWGFMAFLVVTVLGYHLVNVIKSFF